jgi:hypothetical protein
MQPSLNLTWQLRSDLLPESGGALSSMNTSTNTYVLEITSEIVGIHVLELFVDGVQVCVCVCVCVCIYCYINLLELFVDGVQVCMCVCVCVHVCMYACTASAVEEKDRVQLLLLCVCVHIC